MRDAPAYQEYAAQMLADFRFREMTLAERGLLYSLRLECWVNGSIPADPIKLARRLGFSASELQAALTDSVASFFQRQNDELISPELDAYFAHLEARKIERSRSGKKGAKQRWRSGRKTSIGAVSKGDGSANGSAINQPMATVSTVHHNTASLEKERKPCSPEEYRRMKGE